MDGLGRRFWRVWTASAASNLGDGIALVALPLLAVSVTDDARLVGLVAAARAIPLLIVGPLVGLLVDRVDRRRLMFVVDAFRAAVVATLAVLVAMDQLSIWVLVATAAILGAAELPFDVSSPAVVRRVVRKDQLEVANARLSSAQLITNEFAGGPLGGFLYSVAPWLPLVGTGASFGIASATVGSVDGDFTPMPTTETGPRAGNELFDGHRFVWGHSVLRPQALSVAALAATMGMTTAVMVIYATEHLGVGAVGFGLIGTAGALGALGSTVITPRVIARVGHGTTMALGVALMGSGYLIIALADSLWMALIGSLVGGLGDPFWNVVSSTARQRLVPDDVFGKVVAAYMQIAWSTVAVGAIIGGILAEAYGADTVFLVMTAICAAVLLAGRGLFKNMTHRLAASA